VLRSAIVRRLSRLALWSGLLGLLSGCASQPPRNVDDICAIFEDKEDWYEAANRSVDRWGVPVHVQMAIIHQESKFRRDARPPKKRVLGFIPWGRASSAYGYAQAKDDTWDWYISKTGNRGADRDDFEDAVDFVGWYCSMTHRTNGVSKWDAYNQYLAYHEGHGGYRRRTYNKKAWLLGVARKVEANSRTYARQFKSCKDDLESGWSIWPF